VVADLLREERLTAVGALMLDGGTALVASCVEHGEPCRRRRRSRCHQLLCCLALHVGFDLIAVPKELDDASHMPLGPLVEGAVNFYVAVQLLY
jgi:hypothetical protein